MSKKTKELSPAMQQPTQRRYANESLNGMGSTSIPRQSKEKLRAQSHAHLTDMEDCRDFDMSVGERRHKR